ncbi:hypothetical protein EDB89DRAFT_2246604 [Lactarius sanguifluus]|nr:hypothetical protein EDB89DRAFT_2246604 [Lactarius sanguifluus]
MAVTTYDDGCDNCNHDGRGNGEGLCILLDHFIAAGIVSLLNDYRLSKGRTPLGFLNYWLYDYSISDLGLNDIISGSNPGCNTDGFSASTGWDPVTGLGTLDFAELEDEL